jgi:hypothetical protein
MTPDARERISVASEEVRTAEVGARWPFVR